MADVHISMRGELVDFNKLRMANADRPALGNASMNARGDILGPGGVVIKTQEQVDAEHRARIEDQKQISRNVDLKNAEAVKAAAMAPMPASPTRQMQAPPGLEPKIVDVADAGFEPEVTASDVKPLAQPVVEKSRRRMIESD